MVARMFACLPAYFILVHMWDPTLSVERLPIPVNSRSCDPLKSSRKFFFLSLSAPHAWGGCMDVVQLIACSTITVHDKGNEMVMTWLHLRVHVTSQTGGGRIRYGNTALQRGQDAPEQNRRLGGSQPSGCNAWLVLLHVPL